LTFIEDSICIIKNQDKQIKQLKQQKSQLKLDIAKIAAMQDQLVILLDYIAIRLAD